MNTINTILAFVDKYTKVYKPAGAHYTPNTLLIDDGKTQRVVIGYFGASSGVFEGGIDPEQGLYYGSKKDAQGYAIRRTKSSFEVPKVGIVVADRLPGYQDHRVGQFEGYDPLSPEFMRQANVQIIQIETVTPENRIGVRAGIWRIVSAMQREKFIPRIDQT